MSQGSGRSITHTDKTFLSEYKIFLGFQILKHFSRPEIFSVKLRIFSVNLNNCVVLVVVAAATIIIL